MSYTITKGEAVVYKVRTTGKYGSWAVATIREWPQGGSLDVQSDEGNFAYSWTATGTDRFTDFLRDLEFDYFMGKTHHARGRVFDFEKSIRSMRGSIVEERRRGALTKEQARGRLDDIAGLEPCLSRDEFCCQFFNACDWAYEWVDGETPGVMVHCPSCRRFWDGPWKALCEHWAEENAKAA